MTDDYVRMSIKTETYNHRHPSTDQSTPNSEQVVKKERYIKTFMVVLHGVLDILTATSWLGFPLQ